MDNLIQNIIIILSISVVNILTVLAVFYLLDNGTTKNNFIKKLKRKPKFLRKEATITSPSELLRAKQIENELTKESEAHSTFKQNKRE